MLACWKCDNSTAKWSEGLRFVQWQLNSRHHTGNGRSPYKATFGTEPRLGLKMGLNMPDEVTTEGMHKIGTEHGVLNNLFATNCVTPCREAFLSLENVPDKTVSLRTAANSSAMGTGQGIFKCGCKQKCNSTRCKCFKSNVKCNSKCHSSMPCDNKHD
ncbi:putative KRAB-A domain-containing protein 2-like [Ditylenchus destructor]|uniref:KRAB-A domain-containing protein 2-like n=1 Tax=Ditylenchus destructor TaxID=166010 RepID=A0AAD4QV06_9BILA|nr:putative KRAB-A domain-containing protein 2-like [Ditylenchus destructor]